MSFWLSTCVVLASASAHTSAAPGVVVLTSEAGGSSAFVESLRIQLTGMAEVSVGPATESGAGRAMAERARIYLAASGASIAVWQELRPSRSPTNPHEYDVVVLAVTRQERGRPIEVARLLNQGSDETGRILALKVGELLHQVLAAAKSERELQEELAKRGRAEPEETAPPKPAAPPKPQPPEPGRLRGLVEAGAGLRFDPDLKAPRALVQAGLGGAWHRPKWRVELALGGRRLSDLQAQSENGRVMLRQLDLSLGVRGLWLLPPLAFGANAGFGLDFISASALSLDGRRGSASKVGAALLFGPEVRLRLGPLLEMRTQVVVEPTLYDQRFAIEGQEMPGFRQTHVGGELSLLLLFP